MPGKTQPQTYRWVYKHTEYVDGALVTNTNLTTEYTWVDSVGYSANLPDWRLRIRSGLDCTTAAVGFRSKVINNRAGQLTAQLFVIPAGISYVDSYEGSISSNLDPAISYPHSQELYDSALSAFVSKAREAQHKL